MFFDILLQSGAPTIRRFAPTAYVGTGASRALPVGVALGAAGGLIWIKRRDAFETHHIFDTARGLTKRSSENFPGEDIISAFTPTGANLLFSGAALNTAAGSYIAWIFRNQPGFFNVALWNQAEGTTFAHGLGTTPGALLFVKRTGGFPPGHGAHVDHMAFWHPVSGLASLTGQAPTFLSVSGVGPDTANAFGFAEGGTYAVYAFGNDGDRISSGSWVYNGVEDSSVLLPFAPSFVIVQQPAGGSWFFDVARPGKVLRPFGGLEQDVSVDPQLDLAGDRILTKAGQFPDSETLLYLAVR